MSFVRQFRFSLLVIAASGFFACALSGCGMSRSGVDFTGAGGTRVPLLALCREAKQGELAGPTSTAWFSFNPEKAGIPASATTRGGRGAIEVTIVRDGSAASASAGFVKLSLALVRADELTARGSLSDSVAMRELSTVVSDSAVVRIAMTIPDSGEFSSVVGFAVSLSGGDDSSARITSASVVPARSGWEAQDGAFYAAFSSSGGSIDSRKAATVPVTMYPNSTARISFAASDPGTAKSQNRVVFSMDGATAGFRASPVPYRAYLPSALAGEILSGNLLSGAESVSAQTISGESSVRGFVVERNTPFALTTSNAPQSGTPQAGTPLRSPILADPHMVIEWPQAAWRQTEYELFAWDRFPSILIFDTADYAVQDKFFKRLAFFAEKQGFRGTLADDKALSGLHAYNAHDYRAETLASFFELARASEFPLGKEELALRDILEAEGIIRRDGDAWVAGAGAVLSFSRQSLEYLRYLFMAHEGYHGIYFVDADFRAKVSEVYASMDKRAIDFLESYFTIVDTLGYDREDRYLMENEFMGYLMQQGEANVSAYFTGNIRERFLRYGGEIALADYIESTGASDFVRAAHELGLYAFNRWGITGGRVGLYFFD